ncbi:MAG: polymerase III, delta'' subunit protein [candidate division TM6 bacterium GW2011_GWE2_42_60]|nr:MAG: polymerase III, delta'' subunit protein [candidate division TM6 bacterium GW2011_GWE2_42_60]HBY05632.1 hypothetical protein [Candidatus Dependentiae bacterium]
MVFLSSQHQTTHQVTLFIGGATAQKALFDELCRLVLVDETDATLRQLVHEHKHPQVRWVERSGGAYKRDDLEEVFTESSARRGERERLVFVFDRADLLTESCANSLLKLVEEPPGGVFFLFLASRREFVIPTIVSRSVIFEFSGECVAVGHGLVALFKNPQIATHADLTRVLEAEPLSEHETKQVLDTLLVYWQDSFKTALEQHDLEKQSQAERMLKLFAYGLDRIPMPGGAKFFWRTLFLFLEKK